MRKPIEEALVQKGILTEGQIRRAKYFALGRPGKSLEEVLTELGYISEETLADMRKEGTEEPEDQAGNWEDGTTIRADDPSAQRNIWEEEEENERPAVFIVRSVIERAYDLGASDIHVEPGAEKMTIRFRVNGELRPYGSLPMELHRGVITRLKVMGNMDIAVKTLPQDGACRYIRGRIRADL